MNTTESKEEYLKIVKKQDKLEKGEFRLNPQSGLLEYMDEDGNLVKINNTSDNRRASTGLDLHTLLFNRNFNVINGKEILFMNKMQASYLAMTYYDDNQNKVSVPIVDNMSRTDAEWISSMYEDSLKYTLDDVIVTKSSDGYIENRDVMNPGYVNFKMLKSVSVTSGVYDVLGMTDETYTDIINLNTVSSITNLNGGFLSVLISVSYTDNDGIVSTKDFLFDYAKDFISVFGDITIEYRSKCIRLFNNSENAMECIINNCNLIYGNHY